MKMFGIAAAALLLVSGPALADMVTVPTAPGDAQGPAPFRYFGSGGSRVQQIYDASFFTGPQMISALSFRAFPGASPSFFFGSTLNISDVNIRLSTTGVGGEGTSLASTSFASNLGLDTQTVYSGALSLMTAATGAGPQPFDYTVNFSSPFTYNPLAGNLLLDVMIPTSATVSGTGFGFLTFDTANDLNDGIYSVLDIYNGDATSGIQSTAGAITQFTTSATAVPEPATWAFMIVGFGAIGGMMRRRRITSIFGERKRQPA